MQVGPKGGIWRPDLRGKLREWLERIGGAPLSPAQKFWLTRITVVSRLIYQAVHGDVKATSLRQGALVGLAQVHLQRSPLSPGQGWQPGAPASQEDGVCSACQVLLPSASVR